MVCLLSSVKSLLYYDHRHGCLQKHKFRHNHDWKSCRACCHDHAWGWTRLEDSDVWKSNNISETLLFSFLIFFSKSFNANKMYGRAAFVSPVDSQSPKCPSVPPSLVTLLLRNRESSLTAAICLLLIPSVSQAVRALWLCRRSFQCQLLISAELPWFDLKWHQLLLITCS